MKPNVLRGIMDMHLHSALSFDSDADMLEQCAKAQELGLMGLCFTEHIDHGAENVGFSIEPDRAEYRRRVEQARSAFPDLKIGMGMEVGYTARCFPQNRAIASEDWDCVVWSVHEVDGIDPGGYPERFFRDRDRFGAYGDYLEAIRQSALAQADFEIIGHIGYPARYAPYPDPAIRLSDAPGTIDAMLRAIIARGAPVELNTSGMSGNLGPAPSRELLTRYYALGGRKVTLGSDAHTPEDIGRHFPQAIELLRELGFDRVYSFMGRKPIVQQL